MSGVAHTISISGDSNDTNLVLESASSSITEGSGPTGPAGAAGVAGADGAVGPAAVIEDVRGGLAALTTAIDAHVVASGMGGAHCAQLHVRIGNTVFDKAYGVKSTDGGVPLLTTTPMGIRSMGKLLTSMLIMKFQELGYLTLEDSIATYIPSFDKQFLLDGTGVTSSSGVSAEYIDGNTITLLHACKEENGFGYLNGGLYYYKADDVDLCGNDTYAFTTPASSPDISAANIQEWVAAMVNRGILGNRPGTASYGGGANVLGAVAEKAYTKIFSVTKTFSQLLNEYIATPCGATIRFYKKADISLMIDLPVLEGVDGSPSDHNGQNYPLAGYSDVEQGGNAMWMTAQDYGAIIRMLMSHGNHTDGVQVLKPSTAATILYYKFDEPDGNNGDSALIGAGESADGNVQFTLGMVRALEDVPYGYRGDHSPYNVGLRYWLGKWMSSQFMFVNDDIQIVVNEATKDGTRTWVKDLIDLVISLKKL